MRIGIALSVAAMSCVGCYTSGPKGTQVLATVHVISEGQRVERELVLVPSRGFFYDGGTFLAAAESLPEDPAAIAKLTARRAGTKVPAAKTDAVRIRAGLAKRTGCILSLNPVVLAFDSRNQTTSGGLACVSSFDLNSSVDLLVIEAADSSVVTIQVPSRTIDATLNALTRDDLSEHR